MNILLIDVHYEKTRKELHANSLTLATLAALTPTEHSLELVNLSKKNN